MKPFYSIRQILIFSDATMRTMIIAHNFGSPIFDVCMSTSAKYAEMRLLYWLHIILSLTTITTKLKQPYCYYLPIASTKFYSFSGLNFFVAFSSFVCQPDMCLYSWQIFCILILHCTSYNAEIMQYCISSCSTPYCMYPIPTLIQHTIVRKNTWTISFHQFVLVVQWVFHFLSTQKHWIRTIHHQHHFVLFL